MAEKHAEAYREKESSGVPMTELPPSYTPVSGNIGYQPQSATGVAMVTIAPQVVTQQPSGPPPNDYLIMSILTLLFCFMPLGLVALIKSIEARSAISRGDYTSAESSAKSALLFNKIAIVIGLVLIIVTIIIVVLAQLSWIIPLAIVGSRSRSG